jgi:hypothetical protein
VRLNKKRGWPFFGRSSSKNPIKIPDVSTNKEEESPLMERNMEEKEMPVMNDQPIQVSGDPSQSLASCLGRFNRFLSQAQHNPESGDWAERCIRELGEALTITIKGQWDPVKDAILETARILHSYDRVGRRSESIPFLNSSYEILSLMVGDLILDKVKSSVVLKWKELYKKALDDLQRAGIPLAEDDDEEMEEEEISLSEESEAAAPPEEIAQEEAANEDVAAEEESAAPNEGRPDLIIYNHNDPYEKEAETFVEEDASIETSDLESDESDVQEVLPKDSLDEETFEGDFPLDHTEEEFTEDTEYPESPTDDDSLATAFSEEEGLKAPFDDGSGADSGDDESFEREAVTVLDIVESDIEKQVPPSDISEGETSDEEETAVEEDQEISYGDDSVLEAADKIDVVAEEERSDFSEEANDVSFGEESATDDFLETSSSSDTMEEERTTSLQSPELSEEHSGEEVLPDETEESAIQQYEEAAFSSEVPEGLEEAFSPDEEEGADVGETERIQPDEIVSEDSESVEGDDADEVAEEPLYQDSEEDVEPLLVESASIDDTTNLLAGTRDALARGDVHSAKHLALELARKIAIMEYKQAEALVADVENNLITNAKDIQSIEDQIQATELNLLQTEETLATREGECNSCREQVASMDDKLRLFQMELEDLDTQIEALKHSRTEQVNRKLNKEKEREEMLNSESRLQTEIETLRQVADDIHDELERLADEKKEVLSKKQEIELSIFAAKESSGKRYEALNAIEQTLGSALGDSNNAVSGEEELFPTE